MKNLIKITNILLISSCLSISANAASKKVSKLTDGVYLKAGAGLMEYAKFKETGADGDGYTKRRPKGNIIYNIGIGYRFTEAVRTDLNLEYTQSKFKQSGEMFNINQKIKTMAAFINGYYDINLNTDLFPYITVGVGISQNKASDISVLTNTVKGHSQNNFIWNIGAGTQYKFNDNFALDLGYRYIDLGYIKTDNFTEGEMTSKFGKQKIRGHRLIGSLIYSF